MARQPITSIEVISLAVDSIDFRKIWDRLVSSSGKEGATKKVTDKIRTFRGIIRILSFNLYSFYHSFASH